MREPGWGWGGGKGTRDGGGEGRLGDKAGVVERGGGRGEPGA